MCVSDAQNQIKYILQAKKSHKDRDLCLPLTVAKIFQLVSGIFMAFI